MKSRLLLLVQTHAHAAALMSCIPHLRANYDWVWVVYSPAVLADPALVEKEFDSQITDLTKAMKDCYAREDGAGGDAYKIKRDAAILEKSAKVKDAWKALSKEQQNAAEDQMFHPFFAARPAPNMAISRHADHFETAAHVEFQNSLKAGMKPGYTPGEYVVAWPTSLPKEGAGVAVVLIPPTTPNTDSIAVQALQTAQAALAQAPKVDKRKKENRKPIEPRLTELMRMNLDDLGPIAFELGIKPNDPIAGKRMALVHRIHELEKERTEKELATT